MGQAGVAELRRGVLAVCVLHDLDLEPGLFGLLLPGATTVWVSWRECRAALDGHPPESPAGHELLARLLLVRRWAADVGVDGLKARLRPLGLPPGHALHPGRSWVAKRVLGGALDLGLGAVDLDPADPDAVLPLPAQSLGPLCPQRSWRAAERVLEECGALAAVRLDKAPRGHLRPIGDCDVPTLLGARALRVALARASGGLAAAVVPTRRRGWTQLALVDPAFGPAAAAATSPTDRGFDRPLLVTADSLQLVAAGGRPAALVLEPRSAALGTSAV